MLSVEINGKYFSEDDVSNMSLSEVKGLIVEIQNKIFDLSTTKRHLATLPKSKKDGKTFKKMNSTVDEICKLQQSLTWLGSVKKEKRDTMSKELMFYKTFFKFTKDYVRKGKFEKLFNETVNKTGYSI